MYNLTQPRQKALETARSYWKRADLHPSNMTWRTQAAESFGFDDGSGQWCPEDLRTVSGRGQKPLTINMIQSRIDALSGVEIQSRFRTAVRNSSGNEANDHLAKGLTGLMYFIQQDQMIPYKGSLKFRDMLVCGLGWSEIYQEDGYFYYDYVHPYNIMPDFDDLSPQFDKMKYVCRKRWTDPEVIKSLWPKVAKYIDFSDPNLTSTVTSPEINDRNSSYTSSSNSNGYSQSRSLVCEAQYKVPKTAFCAIDSNGFYFETFDEEKAEEMANSTRDIEEKKTTQTIRTLFIDEFLLETAPLNPNVPGLKDFSLIPCVWKRRFQDGVPYGLVHLMKDIQRDANVRFTKALYLANSSKLIITGGIPPGSTPESLSQQLKSPDTVIALPPDTKFDLRDNAPLSEIQFKAYDYADKQLQRVTGIYDDMMGRETNASSGVAQRQRQLNSVRNNVFSFDSFASMKEREAKFMLALFQGGVNENVLAEVISEEDKETIILNLTREIKGKKVIFNDVRTLPISLEIEEVPDFRNSMEENKVALENVLSNPNALMIMQSPSLLKRLGIRDFEKLSEEMKQTMMAQQASQGGSPQPQDEADAANQEMQSQVYQGM